MILRRSLSHLPGTNLLPKIVFHKRAVEKAGTKLTAKDIDTMVTPQICTRLIPDHIIRTIPHLKRKNLLEDTTHESRRVVMRDGSSTDILSINRKIRPKPSLREESKKDIQIGIRRMKTRERIYNEVLVIFNEKIHDAYLKLPVWRLTRAELSKDNQYCTVRWTIDHVDDFNKYSNHIRDSLERVSSSVRYELGKVLRTKIVPSVRFEYEDYTALNFVDEITTDNIKDQ